MEEDERSPSRGRRAVMSDVGRLAGVSHQTVSRVINGNPHVRPETRERVVEAMLELGYRPNSVARALVTGRSRTLGVVSFDTTLYGPASTLLGIERAAHEEGYFIIVASLKAMDRPSIADAVERLLRHGVDGMLFITPQLEAADALTGASGDAPLVAVEAGIDDAIPVVARARLELVQCPARARHADDRNVEAAAVNHGVQSREDLLVRQVPRGAEKDEGIGFDCDHLASRLQFAA